MSALLPSAGGDRGYGALHLVVGQQLPVDVACNGTTVVSSEFLAPGAIKRKRRPAGTPDPGAEVVALSPKTLMESDRYVCEICNQGFQRDQNLQMHRRRHKVPWKLLKRPSLGTNKRVYICPERSCLHHDPAHALGDLVGIKKHYRRKHCSEKQWKCDKCSKGYAVQSDYKAHLKTCGTRGHCCDCGRVFSRVESFIEHQDSCSAVKHKAMQSEGGSDRVKTTSSSAPHHGTDRNSLTGSPSQSSDTTQAMPFAMSDTAARSSVDHTKVADEHSRRIQEGQAVAATPSTTSNAPPMPAWLADHHSRRRNELELLPSQHRVVLGTTDGHYSKSQNIVRSSISLNPHPESKTYTLDPSREPSLQLSMGPYHPELASGIDVLQHNVDTKPSSSSIERVLVHQRQKPVTIPRAETTDLAHHSVPATALEKEILEPGRGNPETDRGVTSLSGFLMQAVRRLGPQEDISNAGGTFGRQITSTRKQQQQLEHVHSRSTDSIGAHYNPCAATGSTSSYHEDLAANMHESDAQGPWVMSRRGFTKSQLEPVTSSDAISSRCQALRDIHKDVAEITNHRLFAANSKSMEEGFRSQNHSMAAGDSARVETCDQVPTDMNYTASWSDLARVRRSKEEARQECEEAQRDIARAEMLKREAREQLQFAAAERAYAESAREVAKRQIEISEAELVRAKRLREHAQSELDKVGNMTSSLVAISSSPPAFCHSCKSALETSNTGPSRKLAATSPPPGSSTWSFMTPSTGLSDQAGTDMNHLWSGDRSNLWPAGYRPSMSSSALSMAIGESPPAFRTGPLHSRVTAGESTASRALDQSDQDHHNIIITPKLDLDLN